MSAGTTVRCGEGLSLWWLLLLWGPGSGCFSSCGTQAQYLWLTGPGTLRTQYLWCMGLVAPRFVESSLTRDQTCVHCIGRWIPIKGKSLIFHLNKTGQFWGTEPSVGRVISPCYTSNAFQLLKSFFFCSSKSCFLLLLLLPLITWNGFINCFFKKKITV